jgi:MFS family permease
MSRHYKLLLTSSLLVNLGDNLIGPLWAVFVQGIGGTILVLGYAAAISSFVTGFAIIAVGKLSDHMDKTVLTFIGYILFALGTLGYLIISEPWHLYLLQIVFGLGGALLAAPLTALFARYINKESEGFQWSLGDGGGRLMVGVAVLSGAFIVNAFGFTALFLTMFAIQAIAIVIYFRFFLLVRQTARR